MSPCPIPKMALVDQAGQDAGGKRYVPLSHDIVAILTAAVTITVEGGSICEEASFYL